MGAINDLRLIDDLFGKGHLLTENAALRAGLSAVAAQHNTLVNETRRRGEVIGLLEQQAIAREHRIVELEQAVRERDNQIDKLNKNVEGLVANANAERDRLHAAKAASDPYHDQEDMRLIRQILGIHWRN